MLNKIMAKNWPEIEQQKKWKNKNYSSIRNNKCSTKKIKNVQKIQKFGKKLNFSTNSNFFKNSKLFKKFKMF